MSHSRERKEKICLNCNAALNGRFCHVCGQENLEPKESAWGLVSHFFYDITHFDGKFFSTLGYLVSKPGFLPKEYLRGRRASYLNPIRMYVFSSALFFLIFFSLFSPKDLKIGVDKDDNLLQKDSLPIPVTAKQKALENAKTFEDSAKVEEVFAAVEGVVQIEKEPTVKMDSAEGLKWNSDLTDEKFNTTAQYDSAQKSLAPDQRDGRFKRLFTHRRIELNNKYKKQPKQFIKDVLDKFIHSFPYLLFVSLPLYALFLKLLYIRRKQFYYVNHGIFLVYLYIFTFIILLIFFSLMELHKIWDTSWLWVLQTILFLYGLFYTVKAMRNFYGQGWGKTIVKFILLNFLAVVSLVFLFALFFMLTVFRL
ncbi:MAG: DUF3667 domain-containing protein [Chitinophagaceae bacterium]|nr:DUF3667 domain-containing protein [Chitinophagaceae bacterium]